MNRVLATVGLIVLWTSCAGAQGNPIQSGNINSILWIGSNTGWSGDLGAQFNSAEAALPANGGEIDVVPPSGSPPTYSVTSPLIFNKTVKLKCVRGGYTNGQTGPPPTGTPGGPVNFHTTTVLNYTWSGTGQAPPPIQMDTPMPITSISVDSSTGVATVVCPKTSWSVGCAVTQGQLVVFFNTNSSFNYNRNAPPPTGPLEFYVTATNTSNPTQFMVTALKTSASFSGTGGSMAFLGGALGSSIEGCQLNYSGTVSNQPAVFVDMDNSANDILLDSMVVDTPTVEAGTAVFRYGETNPVVNESCRDTFVRTAAPVAYLLLNITAGFTGYNCAGFQSGYEEWSIGGTSASNQIVEDFTCYGCTAQAGVNNNVAVYLQTVYGFHWYGGYMGVAGASTGQSTYAVEIVGPVARGIQVDGAFVSGYGNAAMPPSYPANVFGVFAADSEITVTNNWIGGNFAPNAYVVNNPSSTRTIVTGNDVYPTGSTGMNIVETTAKTLQCGNVLNGNLISTCTF